VITTGAARDYAETRFTTHNDQFNEVKTIWQTFESTGTVTVAQEGRLNEIERRDSVFPDINPGLWAKGAHQEREAPLAPATSESVA
jgi:1,4-alpha-glucan branching enzyme